MLDCPYSDLELKIAAIGLANKFEDPEFVKKAEEVNNQAEQPTKENIAKFHGISVKDLIDSPNYKVLVEEYGDHKGKEIIRELEGIGLSNKEAWVVLASIAGLLV